MNKKFLIMTLAMMMLSSIVIVAANDASGSIGLNITTQNFEPRVWLCQNRTIIDDPLENGANGALLTERKHNYAFEGESITWRVLVMDKNGVESLVDVVGTVGATAGKLNDVEVECKRVTDSSNPATACNAKIYEENLTTFDPAVMSYYDCRLTVETPLSMQGEFFLTVEAMDNGGKSGIMAENEFWYLNPAIALSVQGGLNFQEVMPGTTSYSTTLLVGNDADPATGVMLDMFISGTDFYDRNSVGARCSDNTNKLALNTLSYFVTNGAYSSLGLASANADVDAWGYTNIPYGNEISPSKRIMRYVTTTRGPGPSSSVTATDWTNGNVLSPESEMALTFRLNMPEPCVGDFSDGQIYFWGEAI